MAGQRLSANSHYCFRISKELLDRYDVEVRVVSAQLQPAKLPSYALPLANGHGKAQPNHAAAPAVKTIEGTSSLPSTACAWFVPWNG